MYTKKILGSLLLLSLALSGCDNQVGSGKLAGTSRVGNGLAKSATKYSSAIENGTTSTTDFSGLDLTAATFVKVKPSKNMIKANLYYGKFTNGNFTNAIMNDSKLNMFADGADFSNAQMERANFWTGGGGSFADGASLESSIFYNANLKGAEFFKARVKYAIFDGADLTDAKFNVYGGNNSFNGADLTRVDFRIGGTTAAKLDGSNFTDAILEYANLHNVYARRSNFTGAKLTNANLNAYLEGSNFTDADLREATVQGGRFDGANFHNAIINGIDFSAMKLHDVNLNSYALKTKFNRSTLEIVDARRGIFTGASFTNANLENVDFSDADLTNVDFRGAVLKNVDLDGAKLDGADFSGASVNGQTCSNGSIGSCNWPMIGS